MKRRSFLSLFLFSCHRRRHQESKEEEEAVVVIVVTSEAAAAAANWADPLTAAAVTAASSFVHIFPVVVPATRSLAIAMDQQQQRHGHSSLF